MRDAPLLALTRQAGDGPSPETTATRNMRQLVQLRWLAVGGQLVTILGVDRVLGVPLPLAPMLVAVAALALANLATLVLLPRHRVTNVEIMLALLLDMGLLTAQLYFSGGADNPFVSLFLLQVVLGAILLERWSAGVLIAATSLCYAGLSLRSVPLVFPAGLLAEVTDLVRLGAWIAFVLVAGLLMLFIGRISRNLRARDAYLADLRRQAAEEDGIVRMGLLASGAAHELGSPLASIAVILGDWRRDARVADVPDLAADVAEMQAEIARCKAIVGEILDTAGEPRGEALEAMPAHRFLDDAVAAWRRTRPALAVNDARAALPAGDMLIAGDSLRQAIWTILDNAAEASPHGIALAATRDAGELAFCVLDRGPGFSPDQLEAVGRAQRSAKGAGHGVGLLLAGTVARRLGGRLEAANRADGGAEVCLILPLAAPRGEA